MTSSGAPHAGNKVLVHQCYVAGSMIWEPFANLLLVIDLLNNMAGGDGTGLDSLYDYKKVVDSEVQNSGQISLHNHRVLCSGPGHGPCPHVHCARQYQANNHMSCP